MNGLNSIQTKISKSSSAVSVVLKICSIAIIVGFCMEIIALIWIGTPRSNDTIFKMGEPIFHSPLDSQRADSQIAAEYITAMTQQIFVWFMIFLAYRIFREISVELRAFELKHAARIRKTAILILVSGVVVPSVQAAGGRRNTVGGGYGYSIKT